MHEVRPRVVAHDVAEHHVVLARHVVGPRGRCGPARGDARDRHAAPAVGRRDVDPVVLVELLALLGDVVVDVARVAREGLDGALGERRARRVRGAVDVGRRRRVGLRGVRGDGADAGGDKPSQVARVLAVGRERGAVGGRRRLGACPPRRVSVIVSAIGLRSVVGGRRGRARERAHLRPAVGARAAAVEVVRDGVADGVEARGHLLVGRDGDARHDRSRASRRPATAP